MLQTFRETFRAISTDPDYDEPLYPSALEAIDALRASGALLAVATGKGRRGLRMTLERHGIIDRFEVLKTADDGPGKPHPQILLDAMADLGASAETTVMLGDTAYDMAMARAAEAHAIGVAWGYHAPEDLAAHGAAHVLHDYAEVPGAVAERIGSGR